MRSNKGISMIALIITIIVIIILAAIIFIASGDTVSSANYATFSQEFGDYGLNFQNDALADVKLKYGTQGKVISNPQAVYLASNPENTMTDGLLIPAGVEFVTKLKTLTNPALYEDGETDDVTLKYWGAPTDGAANNANDIACYELADDAIDGYKKPQFYGDNLGEEKHYVTQNGFVFTLPGYPREVDGENRLYIASGVYYIAGEKYQNLVEAEDAENVGVHNNGGTSEEPSSPTISPEESIAQLKVGDYVDYKSKKGETVNWRVWSNDGTTVVIKPEDGVESLALGHSGSTAGAPNVAIMEECFEDWKNCERLINNACKEYTNASLGITAENIRSLTIGDIEDKLKSPKKPASFTSKTYTKGRFGEKIENNENIILENLVVATDKNPIKLKSDYWGGTPTWNNIPDSTKVAYGNLIGSSLQWLASPCVAVDASFAFFGVRVVASDLVDAALMFTSHGDTDIADDVALAPLVSLSSTTIKTTSGNGSQGTPWHLELAK